jgi:hypothetical protein
MMGNMHRILWFDEQVRFGKYPNSSHLAERFEISVRQACRDIEYLTDSLRAPLVYNPKRRGYQYGPNVCFACAHANGVRYSNDSGHYTPLRANGHFVWGNLVFRKSSWAPSEHHF